jgi:hypothetical protein
MTYDELYGINLDEYCEYHDITIDGLVEKVKRDIELLKKNLHKIVRIEGKLLDSRVDRISDLIDKKEKHLKRLKEWGKSKKKLKELISGTKFKLKGLNTTFTFKNRKAGYANFVDDNGHNCYLNEEFSVIVI